jgi:hypothetical protein
VTRSAVVPTVLAILVAVVLAACGSDDSGGSSTADNAAATSSTQSAPAPAATSEPTEAATSEDTAAAVAKCHKTYDPVIAQLRKIQSSVSGKPKYRAFTVSVGKLESFSPVADNSSCSKTVGALASASHLQYWSATRTWVGCRKLDTCSGEGMRYIQDRWSVGSDNLARAREGFGTISAG